MERVVYLLGAGFSAPLGLPVMSNFLVKSKDMYFENPDRYKHFKKVFSKIRDMSVCKNYYETDLFNIEEILSILEMGKHLEGKKLEESFPKYIADVIEHYTPSLPPFTLERLPGPGDWWNFIFGEDPSWNHFGFFIGNIHSLSFQEKSFRNGGKYTRQVHCAKNPDPETRYSIITLNYDLIPEKICNFINENHHFDGEISFITDVDGEANSDRYKPFPAKLHGSIDTTIVPPTWSKGTTEPEILAAWKLAHKSLIEANYLRIIGYSLPTTDTYVRYLLRSAVMEAPHLKKIDVICLDDRDDSVRKRYNDFIVFDYYRFVNADTEDYLKINHQKHLPMTGRSVLPLDGLERAHEEFMEKYMQKGK